MFYRKCLEQIWALPECFKPLTVKRTDLTGARFQFYLRPLLAGWAEAKPYHLSLGLLDIKTGRAPTTKAFVGCCRAGPHTRWRDAALAPRPSLLVERIADHWRQLRISPTSPTPQAQLDPLSCSGQVLPGFYPGAHRQTGRIYNQWVLEKPWGESQGRRRGFETCVGAVFAQLAQSIYLHPMLTWSMKLLEWA